MLITRRRRASRSIAVTGQWCTSGAVGREGRRMACPSALFSGRPRSIILGAVPRVDEELDALPGCCRCSDGRASHPSACSGMALRGALARCWLGVQVASSFLTASYSRGGAGGEEGGCCVGHAKCTRCSSSGVAFTGPALARPPATCDLLDQGLLLMTPSVSALTSADRRQAIAWQVLMLMTTQRKQEAKQNRQNKQKNKKSQEN